MRTLILAIAALLMSITASAQKTYEVVSPDGTLKANVAIAEGKITYSVQKDAAVLITPSEIAMKLSDGTAYDGTVKLQKTKKEAVDQTLEALFYKKAQVK